jgi:hypothetical protein
MWSIILWIGFLVYAKILFYVGTSGFIVKIFGGFCAYLLFAGLLVAPLFLGLSIVGEWRHYFNTNTPYATYFIFLFLASTVPGALYFKRHHLENLRKLGYFTEK